MRGFATVTSDEWCARSRKMQPFYPAPQTYLAGGPAAHLRSLGQASPEFYRGPLSAKSLPAAASSFVPRVESAAGASTWAGLAGLQAAAQNVVSAVAATTTTTTTTPACVPKAAEAADKWLNDPWGEQEAVQQKLESERRLLKVGAGLQRKPKGLLHAAIEAVHNEVKLRQKSGSGAEAEADGPQISSQSPGKAAGNVEKRGDPGASQKPLGPRKRKAALLSSASVGPAQHSASAKDGVAMQLSGTTPRGAAMLPERKASKTSPRSIDTPKDPSAPVVASQVAVESRKTSVLAVPKTYVVLPFCGVLAAPNSVPTRRHREASNSLTGLAPALRGAARRGAPVPVVATAAKLPASN